MRDNFGGRSGEVDFKKNSFSPLTRTTDRLVACLLSSEMMIFPPLLLYVVVVVVVVHWQTLYVQSNHIKGLPDFGLPQTNGCIVLWKYWRHCLSDGRQILRTTISRSL